MNVFHILNGDCLAEKFSKNLHGEIIIWREALIDGPVSDDYFFENRKKFISENYDSERSYEDLVVKEFEKVQSIPENSVIYFWFEDDLFCQVNFWFLVSSLNSKNLKFFRVFPKDSEKRFAESDEEDLQELYHFSKEIKEEEKSLISNLWKGFQKNNLTGKSSSEIVRNVAELFVANENRFNGNLENQIKKIQENTTDFNEFFRIFQQKFSIYGFGDLQLKNLLKRV